MSRGPNKQADEARKLYKRGMLLKDIAKQLDKPEGTIRRWKSVYDWDNKKSERSDNKASVRIPGKANKEKNREPVAKEVKYVLENAELTEKQRLFCLYFVERRNKVKAYQKAFGCSYENACGHASELWKKDEVQKCINQLLDEYREGISLKIQDLFQWYLDIARADINDFVELHGGLVQIKKDIDGALVSEISDTANGVKIKLNDRMKAMDWLSDHIGVATKRQREELKLLQAQRKKLEQEENAGSGEKEQVQDNISSILSQLQPIKDGDVYE